MAPRSAQAVSWCSWNEWLMVKDMLFSEDQSQRTQGVAYCEMWAHRGRTPAAVESTASLISTQLKDSQRQGEDITAASLQLRMTYSMAITRFVNTAVDANQKGRFAAPISVLASAAELPRVLVDLRQDATHGVLPGLPVLQLAAKRALLWLRENYWNRQAGMLKSIEQNVPQQIERLSKLAAERHSSKKEVAAHAKKLDVCVQKIIDLSSADTVKRVLVPALVDKLQRAAPKADEEGPAAWKPWEQAIEGFGAAWPWFIGAALVKVVQNIAGKSGSDGGSGSAVLLAARLIDNGISVALQRRVLRSCLVAEHPPHLIGVVEALIAANKDAFTASEMSLARLLCHTATQPRERKRGRQDDLSLEQLQEQGLAKRLKDGGGTEELSQQGSDGDSDAEQPAWRPCSHWEPCPLGLLPGEATPLLGDVRDSLEESEEEHAQPRAEERTSNIEVRSTGFDEEEGNSPLSLQDMVPWVSVEQQWFKEALKDGAPKAKMLDLKAVKP